MLLRHKYKKILDYTMFFTFLGIAALAAWVLISISLLPIFVLILSTFICFLITKNPDYFSGQIKGDTIAACLLGISILCSSIILKGEDKQSSALKHLFLAGTVKKEMDPILDDDGKFVHNEIEYRFKADSKPGLIIGKILGALVYILCFTSPFMNWMYFSLANDQRTKSKKVGK